MSLLGKDPNRSADQKLERAEELLQLKDGDPHVEPVDELSRRRAIKAAIREANRV